MTKWETDTCHCVILEQTEKDGTVSGVPIKKCGDHKEVPDSDLYGVLFSNPDGENRMVNAVWKVLFGENWYIDKSSVVRVRVEPWDEINCNYYFNGSGKNRILHFVISGKGFTDEKKTAVELLSKRFGTKLVVN